MKDKYKFGALAVGKKKKIVIPRNDPKAGIRARIAAYAYSRRNGGQFSGVTKTDKNGNAAMVITRVS